MEKKKYYSLYFWDYHEMVVQGKLKLPFEVRKIIDDLCHLTIQVIDIELCPTGGKIKVRTDFDEPDVRISWINPEVISGEYYDQYE